VHRKNRLGKRIFFRAQREGRKGTRGETHQGSWQVKELGNTRKVRASTKIHDPHKRKVFGLNGNTGEHGAEKKAIASMGFKPEGIGDRLSVTTFIEKPGGFFIRGPQPLVRK